MEIIMSIGTNIKKLRIARKLTQEELASHLGITSKAVSQWECDRTSPDISQIPALCNFFQISADQLLNINLPQSNEKKQQLLNRYYELARKGHLIEGFTLLQEGLAKYPNDYTMMLHFTNCSDRICKLSDFTYEEKETIKNQCAEYCKRILDGCTEEFIRQAAISNLCVYYAQKGEIQKAKDLAGKMPTMNMCQEFLFANIYQGTKNNEANQQLRSILLQYLLKRFDTDYKSDSGEDLYSFEEYIALQEKKIALLELMFENSDYGYYSAGLSDFHEQCARHYASIDNIENALYHLEKAAVLAIDFITFMQKDTFTHTSLLFKGMVEKSSCVSLSGEDNQSAILINNMKRNEYDVIRQVVRFKNIIKLLEPYTKIVL